MLNRDPEDYVAELREIAERTEHEFNHELKMLIGGYLNNFFGRNYSEWELRFKSGTGVQVPSSLLVPKCLIGEEFEHPWREVSDGDMDIMRPHLRDSHVVNFDRDQSAIVDIKGFLSCLRKLDYDGDEGDFMFSMGEMIEEHEYDEAMELARSWQSVWRDASVCRHHFNDLNREANFIHPLMKELKIARREYGLLRAKHECAYWLAVELEEGKFESFEEGFVRHMGSCLDGVSDDGIKFAYENFKQPFYE